MDYKKYSLENLENWLNDAISCTEATPQEIYDVIKNTVSEEYYIYKDRTRRCYELLALLNGNGNSFNIDPKGNNVDDLIENPIFDIGNPWDNMSSLSSYGNLQTSSLICDKDDMSPECQKSWNDFWEENHYPEENQEYSEKVKDDGMRPWGHSDLEYLIANPTLTEDRISNFPGEQYTEETLNAMCDKAASEKDKVASEKDKVVKWQLPVEVDGVSGEYYIQFPDDLLEAANIKEDDLVQWIDRGDGSYLLKKVDVHS